MMKTITEVAHILTDGKPYSYYIAGFIISFLAIILSLLHHSLGRDKYSTNTPIKYSFLFLLQDNLKRILAGMILMYLLFWLFDLSSKAAMIGVGFSVAFGMDKLIQFLMERTSIFDFLKPERKKE